MLEMASSSKNSVGEGACCCCSSFVNRESVNAITSCNVKRRFCCCGGGEEGNGEEGNGEGGNCGVGTAARRRAIAAALI